MNKVKKFLAVAGVTGTEKDIELYKFLLAEEGSEFLHAWAECDKIEMLDGLCDTWFVSDSLTEFDANYSYLDSFIINPYIEMSGFTHKQYSKGFQEVCDSNLSKFDKDEQQANETAAHYFSKHSIEVVQTYNEEYGLWVTKSATDQKDRHGKFFPKGKILKSVANYFEPDLYEIAGV